MNRSNPNKAAVLWSFGLHVMPLISFLTLTEQRCREKKKQKKKKTRVKTTYVEAVWYGFFSFFFFLVD